MKKYHLCKQLFGEGYGYPKPSDQLSTKNLQMLMNMYREMETIMYQEVSLRDTPPLPSSFAEGEHFSTMIPSVIQQDIRKKMPNSVQYQHSFTLPSGRTVNLRLWFPSSSSSSSSSSLTQEISDMIRCIYTWFAFLDAHVTSKTCSQELTIYVYMTNFTKKLTNVVRLSRQELSEIHVNSGFTFSCKEHNVIYVFRKEEWLKVLVHESIHALGVDFSWCNDDQEVTTQILNAFPRVQVDRLSSFEAFTETWAELCMILLQICIITKKDSYTKNEVKHILQNCVYYEQGWARIQCIKVLRHYGLTYQELCTAPPVPSDSLDPLYHETKTAVFSYYILKCVLMHHLDAFLTWSRQASHGHGFTHIFVSDQTDCKKNIKSFGAFLVKWSQDPAYCAMMHQVEETTKRMSLGDELRMSLWGGE